MTGDPRVFGSHWSQDAEPHIRLLVCFICKTMEEIPDYHGDAEHDVILNEVNVKHGSLTEQPHIGSLMHVPLRQWSDTSVKRAIVEGIWQNETGFKPSYYDVRNTFKEDANKCFIAHHRSVPCLDWHSDTKLFASPAAKERAVLANELRDESVKNVAMKIWLCDYCAVATHVRTKQFEEAERKGLV